jgi:hypothetical protein
MLWFLFLPDEWKALVKLDLLLPAFLVYDIQGSGITNFLIIEEAAH